jgi:hypothetical protein
MAKLLRIDSIRGYSASRWPSRSPTSPFGLGNRDAGNNGCKSKRRARAVQCLASVQISYGEIWRSTNGRRTYQRRATHHVDRASAPYLGDQGWYDNVIWAGDPTDEKLVIVGGIEAPLKLLEENAVWFHSREITELSELESLAVFLAQEEVCSATTA